MGEGGRGGVLVVLWSIGPEMRCLAVSGEYFNVARGDSSLGFDCNIDSN